MRCERSAGGRVPPTLVIIFAIVALEFALSFWLASYLNDDVGLARGAAVAMVSLLYAANLAGRLVASRLARTQSAERLLAVALGAVLAGLPFLLAATGATAAVAGIAFTGAGIGALFPLTSSLHVQASGRSADNALGQTLTIAALGQIAGPLLAGAIAQATTLRLGLIVLPALTLLAAGGLAAHRRQQRGGRARELPAAAVQRRIRTRITMISSSAVPAPAHGHGRLQYSGLARSRRVATLGRLANPVVIVVIRGHAVGYTPPRQGSPRPDPAPRRPSGRGPPAGSRIPRVGREKCCQLGWRSLQPPGGAITARAATFA